MNSYELTLVVDPDLKLEEQEKLIEKIEKMVTGTKGKIDKVIDWGKKELAYPIKKKTLAFYRHLLFAAPATAIDRIERQIKLEEAVMRYLLVRSEDKEHGAKISK